MELDVAQTFCVNGLFGLFTKRSRHRNVDNADLINELSFRMKRRTLFVQKREAVLTKPVDFPLRPSRRAFYP